VGFEHDDTTRPYVLGSLFNGVDQPGDDLGRGKDGSFAVKSRSEIYAESAGDYTIKSHGALDVEVDQGATLKSDQTFEIDGQNITIKGQAQVSIEGSATLTIKCGGSQIQLSA